MGTKARRRAGTGRRRAATALALLLAASAAAAGEGLTRTLTQDDRNLVNNINLQYNMCLQKKAGAGVDQKQPVGQALQAAVDECSHILADLVKEFDRRRIDPAYYQGLVQHLKTSAIRRQMPALMMREAAGGKQPRQGQE
jgi:hypothetical protein